MKIALLALLGLMLGALGGAALGIGAGLAWVEIFKTTSFEGYSGMLVFFTFMPLGAAIGGLGGALLFGVIAARDAEIAVMREPARRTAKAFSSEVETGSRQENASYQESRAPSRFNRNGKGSKSGTGPHLCNAKLRIAFRSNSIS
jgi:hypothetical protein